MYRLILASQSPRRLELLKKAGFAVSVFPLKVSEILNENLNLEDAIAALALLKAQTFVQAHNYLKPQSFLVVAGDTVVVHQNQVLGKPQTTSEAEKMLQKLSGQTHRVISGLALIALDFGREIAVYDQTLVTFRSLTAAEISEYVASGDPMDKAGAYGIQGAAAKFVSHIEGSLTNVIGLPMELFEKTLQELNFECERTRSKPS
jgi:septum formation protein